MLKKKNLLAKRKEFEEVKRMGRLVQSPSFGLLIGKNQKEETKIGFVVSKKISKKAVIRNRARRLLAEGFKNNLSLLKTGSRIVVLAKQGMVGKKSQEVREEIEKTIKTINNEESSP